MRSAGLYAIALARVADFNTCRTSLNACTRVVFPVLVVALALAAFYGRWVRRLLCVRGVTLVGGMCYSIYLLHYALLPPLAALTARAVGGGAWAWEVAWQVILLVPLLVAVSALFFAAVERPFMRVSWTDHLERLLDGRSRTPRPASAPVREVLP